jgi:hypothetical protein
MKTSSCCTFAGIATYTVAIVGAFLLMGGLVSVMKKHLDPRPANQVRIEERRKAAAEVQAAAAQLSHYAAIDKTKGQYQLRIDQAMEMVVRQWKEPANGRAELMSRLEKFNAPPPPPPSFE